MQFLDKVQFTTIYHSKVCKSKIAIKNKLGILDDFLSIYVDVLGDFDNQLYETAAEKWSKKNKAIIRDRLKTEKSCDDKQINFMFRVYTDYINQLKRDY